jgi:hypothetical protein
LRRAFEGHGGGVSQLAFSADGRVMASASYDRTVLLWDLGGRRRRGEAELTPDRFAGLWDQLAADPRKAYDAVHALSSHAETPALLKTVLRPVPSADAKRTAKWIADLDSDDLEVRRAATAELAKLGEAAAEALRAALKAGPSVEVHLRIEALLEKMSDVHPTPERLRQVRAVEALERLATPGARDLLAELADGDAGARLTREAKDALARLAKRAAP